MDRRTFIGVAAVGLVQRHSAAWAQQAVKVWRIGFLAAQSREALADRYGAFVAALRQRGYVEGRNLVIEARFAEGQYDRLPALADELVRLNVDVIVAVPSPAIRAAQRATTTIPIVFPSTGDPVGSGFAASLAHPGGNITGLSNSNLDVSAKTIELLKAMTPSMSRVALLVNPGSSTERAMREHIGAAAKAIGVRVLPIEVRSAAEIEAAFDTMKREHVEALVIAADALVGMQSRQIGELAVKYRLPSISQGAGYARAGGLMSYGLSGTENYRRAASYVDKILKGAQPAGLPVEQPTKLELLINLGTAKALGLTVPQALLTRADELIE